MPARHIVAIGGSDAGISAALRIRELDPSTDVTVVVADAYPNFSICGIPYYVSGEVTHWTQRAPVAAVTGAVPLDEGAQRPGEQHHDHEQGQRGGRHHRPLPAASGLAATPSR